MSCIVTIGNFDGVHLGHQAVLQTALDHSRKAQLPLLVITFLPHPQVFFQKKAPPFILTHEEKLFVFSELGYPQVEVLDFNEQLASIDADTFFDQILIKKYQCQGLIVGYDFAFGKNRSGTLEKLALLCKENSCFLEIVPCLKKDQLQISSSTIRSLLLEKNIPLANALLGRPFFYEQTVLPGPKKEKKKDPQRATFNFSAPEKLFLPNGFYATHTLLDGEKKRSLTLIQKEQPFAIKTHIIHFNKNLYGQKVRIEFDHFLAEKNFQY